MCVRERERDPPFMSPSWVLFVMSYTIRVCGFAGSHLVIGWAWHFGNFFLAKTIQMLGTTTLPVSPHPWSEWVEFPSFLPLTQQPRMTTTYIAPRALASLSRPTILTSTRLRNSRGHAAAVDPPSQRSARTSSYEEGAVRNDWTRVEIQRIFDAPLMESIFRAVSDCLFVCAIHPCYVRSDRHCLWSTSLIAKQEMYLSKNTIRQRSTGCIMILLVSNCVHWWISKVGFPDCHSLHFTPSLSSSS